MEPNCQEICIMKNYTKIKRPWWGKSKNINKDSRDYTQKEKANVYFISPTKSCSLCLLVDSRKICLILEDFHVIYKNSWDGYNKDDVAGA